MARLSYLKHDYIPALCISILIYNHIKYGGENFGTYCSFFLKVFIQYHKNNLHY